MASVAVVVSACMSAPSFPRRVSVAEVIENARCELYDAVRENIAAYPWLERWAAGFDFSFVVDRDANASTDTSYLVPVHAGTGTFTIGLKASLRQKGRGSYGFKFKILKGLGKFEAINCIAARDNTLTPRKLLNGEIGLRRWLNEAIHQIEAARFSNAVKGEPPGHAKVRLYTGEISDLSYTIEFGVTVDGSLLPSWSLTFPDKSQFKPAFTFTLSEAVTHKLIVALTPIPIERDEPADKTAILGTVNGKTAIVARRVCVMNADNPAQCVTQPTAAAEAEVRREMAAAARDKEDAQRVERVVTQEVEGVRRSLPAPMRNMSRQGMENLPESDENKDKARSLQTKLDELDVAKKRTIEADKVLQERRNTLQGIQSLRVDSEAQTRATRARVIEQTESETSRRLDALIQQQVIRDAFRP